MTREAFIKKWLGNRDYNYCEEHKELMRDDLDSVLDFHNAKKKTCGFCVEPSEKAKQKEALIKLTQMGDNDENLTDKQEMTVAQLLKHDFKSKGSLFLYDSNGNRIYFENSKGLWEKEEYDSNNNCIYHENSYGHWIKREYDSNNNRIYYENSDGKIIDNRQKASCNEKVVEIDGKRYKLTEI